MEKKSTEESEFNRSDDHITRHKSGVIVESDTTVKFVKEQVAVQMFQQENEQEQAGHGHH